MAPRKDEAGRFKQLIDMMRDLSIDPDPGTSAKLYRDTMRKLYGDLGLISISRRGVGPNQYRVIRIFHDKQIESDAFPNREDESRVAPIESGGIIGQIISEERVTVIRDLNVPTDPVLGTDLSPYRSMIATPVFDGGRALNWVIFLSTKADAFTSREVESQILQANLLGGMSNSKRAAKELLEATAFIHHEVDEIASIQRGLLPAPLPAVPGLELAAIHESFDRAGGDYYDVFPIGPIDEQSSNDHEGWWGILIADASGHGPSAAVVVTMLSTLIYTRVHKAQGPGAMLEYLNRHIATKPIHSSFVTAFLMYYCPESRLVRYACAGHNPPLLRSNGEARWLDAVGSFPLGIDRGAWYEEAEVQLQPGDTLLLYTDGITEAKALSGEFFGEERLEHAILNGHASAPDLIDTIRGHVRTHLLGQRPTDDQTMVAMRVL
ncbi:MAG: SpoIIE family protein phosphatase [Candidatus Hydrogenedentes bacterium]|nr:SpoIIE family protein phosphatase [Candidatus Hydrogenedentota bacterium]